MTVLTPELEEAVARGYAERDRDNMEPTIRYFEELLADHPGHPVLTYEVAGAYDTPGREAEACVRYEEAMRLGLEGDTLRRCLCQYGSTLRWLERYGESRDVLLRAREQFPESDSVRVFLALTHNDAGQPDAAVAELLSVIINHAADTDLGRYATGFAGLVQWLADGRPEA
jgi:tetratricopeptide (TPR) repeat protein